MDQIYDWIRNLTGYFLFMAVLENLLPGKRYAKYVKFFAGIVLILLVLQPLAGSAQLEEVVARYYEAFVFRNQADDLKREILGVEKQRLEQIFRQYEQAIEADVSMMAEDAGFTVEECRATIAGEEGTEQFGTVTEIALRVSWAEKDEEMMESGIEVSPENGDLTRGIQIERSTLGSVQIENVEPGEGRKTPGLSEYGAGEADWRQEEPNQKQGKEISRQMLRRQQEEARTAAGKLRRKIAAYYNLEDNYVEIQVMEGKR